MYQFPQDKVDALASVLHINEFEARDILDRQLAEQIRTDHATACLEDKARADIAAIRALAASEDHDLLQQGLNEIADQRASKFGI